MQIAFIAPLLCFVYVAFYGFWCVRKGYNMRELINTIAHIGYQVSDLTRSLAFYEPLGFQASSGLASHRHRALLKLRSRNGGRRPRAVSASRWNALTPLAAVSIIWRWKSATDAVQQRLAALGYPLDEGPIEEDNALPAYSRPRWRTARVRCL